MEFNEDFVNIQRALNSAQNKYGSLCDASITGDSLKTKEITEKLAAVIHEKYKDFLNAKSENLHDGLKKIVIFLLLNSDMFDEDPLMADENCGHLIGSIPTVSKDLLISIFWDIGLQAYVYDFIANGPPSLVIHVIDTLAHKKISMELFDALELSSKSIVGIYTQLLKISLGRITSENMNYCWCRFTEYLKNFLTIFLDPGKKRFEGRGTKDLHYFAGCAMKKLLIVCEHCLKYFVNCPEHNDCIHTIYKNIDYPIEECKHEEHCRTDSISEITNDLLTACLHNLYGVTVDLWLFWVECDEKDERHLQLDIAEASFRVSEAINSVQEFNQKFSCVEKLLPLLQRFATKPISEEDIIMSADLATVMKNIPNEDKRLNRWWKAFLSFDCLCETEETLVCLEGNLSVVDKDDVCRILDIAANKLSSTENLSDIPCERLKHLSLNAVKSLELPLQFEVLNHFFLKHGVTSVLQTKEFNKDCTECFNKSTEFCEEAKKEEFVKQCVAVCLQSPQNFVTKALSEGLHNKQQLAVVINALKELKIPLSALTVNGNNLILHSIEKIILNKFSEDTEADNYICMVVALVNERLISGKLYIEMFLLPSIHETATKREWSCLLIWLQTLHVFVDGTVNEGKSFSIPAVLIMLAQLLEAARWNISTYTPQLAAVRQETIAIINVLLNENSTDIEEEILKTWLSPKLKSILRPINIPYFKKLLVEDEFVACERDLSSALVAAMHGKMEHSSLADIIRKSPQKDMLLKAAVLQVLPELTSTEWKLLSACVEKLFQILKPESNAAIESFHIFMDVIVVITAVIKRKNAIENFATFLDFSLQNLGLLIMENTCQALVSENVQSSLQIFQKVLYLFNCLPQSVQHTSCSIWVNVCASLMGSIVDGRETAEKLLTEKNIAVSLSVVPTEDLRQPLAKKLLDIMCSDFN
ncbi:uncharacterized protein LOC126334606 [Schistocerca gregaria]|uniref:uncharacterized protein LOC126334606 n=1 Tax=Schistocerca gregaria TaxID=7010 RepID=UPI00211E135A|nr:uncharacterized protein LOC126334606 [Schistocerca gregaria]